MNYEIDKKTECWNWRKKMIKTAGEINNELLESLKEMVRLIEQNKLVWNIEFTPGTESFFEQSKERIIALTNANLAIRNAEKR